jgi:GrpB-like predicted nucleotidyltransferase (UPF0157 family)
MSPITIVEYDSSWPAHFEEIRRPIAAALDGLATTIEHVGSTAVPGLAGKPIIDLDVLLKNSGDMPEVVNRLHPLGYRYQGDFGISGRDAFSGPAGVYPHHLYVCQPNSDEFKRHILFRDYLRSHLETVAEYAALKRELAATYGADRAEYSRAKSHFVIDILTKAAREKQ